MSIYKGRNSHNHIILKTNLLSNMLNQEKRSIVSQSLFTEVVMQASMAKPTMLIKPTNASAKSSIPLKASAGPCKPQAAFSGYSLVGKKSGVTMSASNAKISGVPRGSVRIAAKASYRGE